MRCYIWLTCTSAVSKSFRLGRRCCGRWCSASRTVASYELFWTCSACRAPCTFGAANRTWGGLFTLPPVMQYVGVGMLVIGCLCGSTLFWVAKSSLDDYLLALQTFFCRSGSRNVGEILVLVRGRMPCCYHLDFCRLSRMRCLVL
jgi:hypothetical protein